MEPTSQEDAPVCASSSSEPAEGLVPAEVPAGILEQMMEMGFSKNRAVRAIYFSEAELVEQAISWIADNEDAEDLDEPLFVKPKKQLTEEEKREQIEELRKKAKERREKEEKEAERVQEKERIRMGKEMQATLEKEKEQEMQRLIELRKREKEEDKLAKERIRMKLEEDRRERRRKLGLPEELTEEEKAKEQAKKQAKMEEEAERLRKHTAYAKPVGITEKLRGILVTMKQTSGDGPFKTACGILLKYVGNVVKNPEEEKFRHIRLSNAAFQQKVASVSGGVEFLNLCGFHRDGDFLVMNRGEVNIEILNAAGTVIDNAVNNPFFGSL